MVSLNNPHKKVMHNNHFTYILSEKPQHLKRAKDIKLTKNNVILLEDSSLNGSKAVEWKEHSLALDSGRHGLKSQLLNLKLKKFLEL